MLELLLDPSAWLAFITLLLLEIVLGIDNVVFISILAGRVAPHQRKKARVWGLGLAIVTRLLLLMSLSFLVGLTAPLFTIVGHELSGRDLVLCAGGVFLVAKATHEIHERLEGETEDAQHRKHASFATTIAQIVALDVVFSLDSVITAVGMVDRLPIMIAAVIVATLIMIFASGAISTFVDRHPTFKMLALSFLLLIGVTLVLEGFDHHVPKGYVYVAMAFSIFVELLNMRARKRGAPVKLRSPYEPDATDPTGGDDTPRGEVTADAHAEE